MSLNILNQTPYLRTTRNFPKDEDLLLVQINKAYVDIANCVNDRIIGIFAKNRPAITGSAWYINNNQKQQSLRQIYTFIAAGNIPHNIPNLQPGQVINGFGSYTDGTNTFGVIFGTSVALAGEVTFYVTTTNIVIGAGAGAPAISSGIVNIEWLSQP